ncbi:MAG: chorismate-binding protein, partial [Fimbriimonadales bacterium]|nr:chorismate-binding protein [Fimbriimonadales bacterium]
MNLHADPMTPCALLKYHPSGKAPVWLVGQRPHSVIEARTHAEVLPALEAVAQAAQRGHALVGFMAFEAAHGLDPAFPQAPAPLPLVWFGVYKALRSVAALEHALPPALRFAPSRELPDKNALWQPTVSRPAYDDALQRIRAYIEAGDVYQVNYSFRLCAAFEGDPLALFWRLYQAQPVPYAAYIDTGAHVILSLSPELFFALEGERIVSRPMKGTAARGRTLSEDYAHAEQLRR